MIAALRVSPQNVEQIQQIEGSTIYDADTLAKSSGGWIRPLAIRATSGHSFSGEHNDPLCVNIDYDKMNMALTRDLALSLAGGYHVTRLENLHPSHQKDCYQEEKLVVATTCFSVSMHHGTS